MRVSVALQHLSDCQINLSMGMDFWASSPDVSTGFNVDSWRRTRGSSLHFGSAIHPVVRVGVFESPFLPSCHRNGHSSALQSMDWSPWTNECHRRKLLPASRRRLLLQMPHIASCPLDPLKMPARSGIRLRQPSSSLPLLHVITGTPKAAFQRLCPPSQSIFFLSFCIGPCDGVSFHDLPLQTALSLEKWLARILSLYETQ
jgi:hypothetical protein